MKQQNPNAKYIINDVNEELIGLFTNIRDNCDLFINCLKIWETSYLSCSSVETKKFYYYAARDLYWKTPESRIIDADLSALLYTLMKTSFNGIWQTCLDSHGRFGTPFGLGNQKDKIFDYDLIKEWSKILKDVEIKCGDANSLDIPPNSVLFCDPPYRSSFTNYGTGFDDNEQKRLVKTCERWKKAGSRVFLTNRDSGDKFFENLLPNSTFHRFPITYTAGRRKKTTAGFSAKKATELLIEI